MDRALLCLEAGLKGVEGHPRRPVKREGLVSVILLLLFWGVKEEEDGIGNSERTLKKASEEPFYLSASLPP